MTPGETALTRTGASSAASGPTIASRAPLSAARPAVPGSAARAQLAVTSVIGSTRAGGATRRRGRTSSTRRPRSSPSPAARQRREALRRLLERHAVAEPELMVEQAYGVLWYRLLLSH